MNLGLSFSIFGKATCVMGGKAVPPEEKHFAQCQESGIEQVELLVMDGYLAPGDWAALDEVVRLAEKYKVKINSVHGPAGYPTNQHWMADPDPEVRKRAVAERALAIEAAARLDARYCVVEYEAYTHWPYWPHEQSTQTVFPEVRQLWRESLEQLLHPATLFAVKLAIENIDGLPAGELMEELEPYTPDLVGVCLDTSHGSYENGLKEVLDVLTPRIIATHLSDNDCLGGSEYSDRHWFPFKGAIDWPWLLGRLACETACECLVVEVLDREQPWLTPEFVAAYSQLEALLP